jgi:hypothetical protein
VRHVLERGLEYVEAVMRAGMCPEATSGDDLYDFLVDPAASGARARAFTSPTL